MVIACVSWASGVCAASDAIPYVGAGWVIESADYKGDVKDQIARMEAHYTIRVIQDGWSEIPLAIHGATITAIELTKKAGEAHIMPCDGSYILVASRKGAYGVRVKFAHLLAQDSQFEGVRLGIPQATFSTVSLFVPRQDVELRTQDQLYVERKPDGRRGGVTLMARLGAAQQLDLRWRTKPTAPVAIEPVLYGDVQMFVSIEEQLAHVTSIIDYRVAQGDTKELLIQLPSGINVLNVRGAGIEDWHVTDAKDGKVLKVALALTLKDTTYRLILEGEQTISADATEYALPTIQLTGVKQERGYLAVARAGNIELAAQTMDGITRVDVKELPETMRTAAGAPAVLAFKYHQHPYRVALSLTHHQDHAVLAAIAERAELATIISQQGELLTRAAYLIQANKKQYVSVLLPEGATLWSCLVDGKLVKPVGGEHGALLVPMDAAAESAQAVSVELVYFEHRPQLVRIGHLGLVGPVLDIPTTIANWSIYAPHEVKFLRMSGNLERGLTPVEFVEEPFIQTAYAQTVTGAMVLNENGRDDKPARVKLGFFKELNGGARAAEMSNSNSEGDGLSDLVGEKQEMRQRHFGLETPKSAAVRLATSQPASPDKSDSFEAFVGGLGGRLNETGILPLKIHLPKAGHIYHFSRLMTSEEALRLDTTFVHLRLSWIVAACALILLPIGGGVWMRIRRA